MSTEYFMTTLHRRDALLNRSIDLLKECQKLLSQSEVMLLADMGAVFDADTLIADIREEMENNQ